MKTRLFFISFLLIFLSFSSYAQKFDYKIMTNGTPFVKIEGKEISTKSIVPLKLGFDIELGDKQYDIVYISPYGFISFDEADNPTRLEASSMLSVCLAKEKPYPYTISYIIDQDQKTLKIQWNIREKPIANVELAVGKPILLSYPDDTANRNYLIGLIWNNEVYGNFSNSRQKQVVFFDFEKSNSFEIYPVLKTTCKSSPKAVYASDYVFSTSTTTYTTVAGTNLNTIEADDATQTASIGFTFNYCGTDYTDVTVSSNGWLVFGTGLSASQLTNDLDGTSYSPEDRLAPLWDDLDGTGHGARCNTSGTAPNRIFEVEWRNWEWNYSANTNVITFKIVLYESDNHIEFVYRRESGAVNNGSASIGIQDANGHFLSLDGTGSSPSANSATETTNLSTKPATGQVYIFTPPSPCTTPTDQPTNLSLTSVSAFQIDGSFNAATSSPDGYLVVRSKNSTLSADPVDGTVYSAGESLGGGTVVQASSSTTFSSTCLAANTTYYYFIFSYNSACSGGPVYLTSNSTPSAAPLTGNIATGSATADKTLPYFQNFNNDDGWTYGAGGTWARGNQTDDNYGPPSGVSGTTVAGTNLNANYANNIDDYLVTPTFDLSGTSGPILEFWMDMESESGYDGGTVQIRVNQCSWITIDKDDPGYSGLVPNDDDVNGLQSGEDGWSGTQPAGEWDEVKIDLFALTTPGLNNISSGDIIQARFWFGSDGSKNTKSVGPGWYIDDFYLHDQDPCTEPTAQPTNLSLTPGYTTIDGSFDAASPEPDGYLVVISTDPTLSAGDLPVDGTIYSAGNTIGDGTVVQTGSATSFTATGLTMGTTYYFFIFSYNETACAGINYLTTNPLSGNTTTYTCSTGTVPYTEDFDAVTAPALPVCWAIQNNGSASVDWVTSTSYDRTAPNCLHISYDFSDPLDNWAFSPGLSLQAGHNYVIEFYYRASSSSYDESMEVCYGTSQNSSAMTTQLWDNTSFNNTDYQFVSVTFSPSSTDVYYFGWHAYSIANQLGINVDDIFIYEQGSPTISSLSSDYLYKDRGKQITITGTNLGYPTSVDIGGITGTVISANYYEAVVNFPAGTYPNGTLTYTTSIGSTTTTIEIRTRNIIPVDASAGANDDEHQTITSAVDGLYAWYGNTAFNSGELPGEKTILVNSGTYNEMVQPNNNLHPVASARLNIEVKAGQTATVTASGYPYGFYVDIDYTTIKGFIVNYASQDNIHIEGNNCVVEYNECYKASVAGVYAKNNTTITHNLLHTNRSYGIYLENGSNNNISQNTLCQNGGLAGASGYARTVDLGSGSIYNWEFSTSWTDIPFDDDDEKCIDFGTNGYPFQFQFWGTQFGTNTTDSIGISSNGHLLLDGDIYGPGSGLSYSLDYDNHRLSWHGENAGGSTVLGNDNMISCFWDDIYNDAHGGEVSYRIRGTAPYRRLIVVWHDRVHYSSSANGVSVEVKLFETTNVIEFHYQDLVFSNMGDSVWDWGRSATIGIKKDDFTFDQYHFSDTCNLGSDEEGVNIPVDHNLQGGAIRYTPNPTTGTELYIASGTGIILENNIMQSLPETAPTYFYVIQAPSGAIATFNYNDVYKGSNTYLAKIGGTDYADLTSWGIGGSGNIETDPKFVDINNFDFHIKSSATGASFHDGEWPPLTAAAGTWTADSDLSPNVDAGDPAADYSLEQPDNGGRLNIGCYGNTLQATKTAVLVGIWTGAVDSLWNVPNNWSDGVVPTGSCVSATESNATIPDVSGASGNFPYITGGNFDVQNLTIETNAYIRIAPDAGLTVCGTLTNNAGNSGIIILSDANGDGSLIHTTSGVQATIYRYLSGTQYHYISTPIDGATTSGIGIQAGANGYVQFYQWDATMQWNGMGINPPATIDYAPWGTSYSGTLENMRGYAYYYYPSTLTFQGNINVGDFTQTLFMNSGGDSDDQGWNLLGNPYASAIDWDHVTFPSEMESALYEFYDDDGTGVQANYRYYVPSGGTGGTYGVGTGNATNAVPVGQGFFVKTNANNVDFTISNDDRVHSTQDFYKEKEIHENFMRIKVTDNITEDEAIVRFIEPATFNFDGKYDARKLFPSSYVPQIYSISNNGVKTAINSMPEITQSYDLPLGFLADSGQYQMLFDDVTFRDINIYLEDKQQENAVQLNYQRTYKFNHNGGIDENRFVLHFVVNTAPYVSEIIPNQVQYANTGFNFTISRNAFVDEDFGDYLTYTASIDGKILPDWLYFDPSSLTFASHGAPTGEYNIKITATDSHGEAVEQIFTLYVLATTGINRPDNDIIIYPNPTDGIFIINMDNTTGYLVEVTNVNGQIIKTKVAVTNACQIDLSDYPTGIYNVKIITDNKTFTNKILKK